METCVDTSVREVTDAEIAFYREHGWARFERLIAPELAMAARAAVEARLLERAEDDARITEGSLWRGWYFPGRDDGIEPIRSLAFSAALGRNAKRLVGRDVAIRYVADNLLVKMPSGHLASAPTGFHQDLVNFPFDRAGFLTFWIALDEVTPAQGALRFYDGSHKLGKLTQTSPREGPSVPELHPELAERCPLSPPLHLQPGDATVHSALTVHGAPENATERPRWGLQLGYFPDDTRYTGAQFPGLFGPDMGLTTGEPFRHPNFPIVAA